MIKNFSEKNQKFIMFASLTAVKKSVISTPAASGNENLLDPNLFWNPVTTSSLAAQKSTLGKMYSIPIDMLTPKEILDMKTELKLSDGDAKTSKAIAKGTKKQRVNQEEDGSHVAYNDTKPGYFSVPRAFGEAKFGPAGQLVTPQVERMKPGMTFACTLMNHPVPQVQATNAVFRQLGRPELCALTDNPTPNGCWSATQFPVQSKGATLILPCGFGKTICGIYVAYTLGEKTAILVHKEFLVDQWRERIYQCLPDARVGIVQQAKIDVKDKDFVIFMIPSLVSRQYDPEVLKGFGLVIVDEAHRIAAESFSTTVPLFASPYRLAITATPNRKDGKAKFLAWTMGPVCFQATRTYEDVRVCPVRYHGGKRNEYRIQGWEKARDPSKTMIVARMTNDIGEDEARNEFCADGMVKDYFAGRYVLALSDRVAQLEDIKARCILKIQQITDEEPSIGIYFGAKVTKQERKDAETKRMVFGSNAMAAEGLDLPRMDTLWYLTPRATIEQQCGRVLRTHPDKTYVIIRDIIDTFSCFEGQWYKRLRMYKAWGYTIQSPTEIGPKGAQSQVVVVTYAEMARDRANKKRKASFSEEQEDE